MWPKKIRKKYFVIMISLSVPPLFLLGIISHNITKKMLIQNQMQFTEDHLKTSSEQTDLLFRDIIKMQRLISWDKELHQELKDSAEFIWDEERAINEITTNRILNLASRYLINTQDIDSFCLFDNNFRSICYGKSSSIGHYGSIGTFKEIAEQKWYKKVLKAKGKGVFFGFNVLAESSGTFSSVKLLKDPEQLYGPNKTGLLVVNIKKSIFSKVLNKGKNNKLLVLDSSGQKINPVYEYPSSFKIQNRPDDNHSDTFQELKGEGFLLSNYRNQTTGWTFVSVIEEKELLKQSNQIGWATTLIASLIAICALFFSFILSGTITRPLTQLKKLTVGWAKEVWNFEEHVDKDEIETIGETFNRLSKERQELNELLLHSQLKEREAELRTLQAQIKPHFLYNTLDSIYWMAVIQNNTEIAKMAVSLSESFKLSLNNGKDFILVSKELEHINHYMAIQNLRYRDRFQYIQEIQTELLDLEILKLLLQPLIENAIYHGLEPKAGEGTIRLNGKMTENRIFFTVEDDGVGIENMDMLETGFGLKNVRERLALYYGPSSNFTISSKINEGTRIEIEFDIGGGMSRA
jgi:two-component system, sensor histidine kinase YesM